MLPYERHLLSDRQKNKKRFVQIDLSIYGEVWEDFMDVLLASAHQHEETIDLDDFIEELKSNELEQINHRLYFNLGAA
ncbi:MAG TPA: hypothetical protein PKD70_06635 [Saprospiraceae bacterium]|nr:hypothetical protein [Saprospiraceae bacterium]HMP13536.1 hypothetical protein [Saprospiraceae bacterium]